MTQVVYKETTAHNKATLYIGAKNKNTACELTHIE